MFDSTILELELSRGQILRSKDLEIHEFNNIFQRKNFTEKPWYPAGNVGGPLNVLLALMPQS